MRLIATAVMAALALGPVAAVAQETGRIVCQKDVERTARELDQVRDRLSPEAVRDAERRLDIASSQCHGQTQLGQITLSRLRGELGMESEQTASTPWDAEESGSQ
ncbi:hypothetical protein [Magnetospirillum sp. UT-4]|uniref:hypothetical protein n=1 Tax=Magnetospirillum sp. UT-4 TaxID=2681467 RepID=UPI001380071D|nr:hypothetical protein [Magnetospirillum sp. UT-4]CAA7612183.1 exported hypothetical protein [Magnetospirillum sp. UT-4]